MPASLATEDGGKGDSYGQGRAPVVLKQLRIRSDMCLTIYDCRGTAIQHKSHLSTELSGVFARSSVKEQKKSRIVPRLARLSGKAKTIVREQVPAPVERKMPES